MKIQYLDEFTSKEVEKDKPKKIPKKDRETYGLEFVPNQETLDALDEGNAIARGEKSGTIYHSFEEMWSDICGT